MGEASGQLVIHFTEHPATFEPLAMVASGMDDDEAGLMVYHYVPDRAQEIAEDWLRDAVILEVPADALVLVQEYPLGYDPARDEYLIPAARLADVRVVHAWYRE